MTKCEVEFEEDVIYCNGFEIKIECYEDYSNYFMVGGEHFMTLEQAIKYCLEN